jgi:hypothetical protein
MYSHHVNGNEISNGAESKWRQYGVIISAVMAGVSVSQRENVNGVKIMAKM